VIEAIGTYLPVWGSATGRVPGEDEDVVTMAVAAGRGALADPGTPVDTVVLISRELPLLEGGNGAPLLAGLDLELTVDVREEIGGAPAALEAVTNARPGTLVIAADVQGGAGAAAVRCGSAGPAVGSLGRVTRSLPVVTRDASGTVTEYADPRLLRERGVRRSLERLGPLGSVVAVAGLARRDAEQLTGAEGLPALPTTGASAALFALAEVAEGAAGGPVLAVEQATVALVELGPGPVAVHRDEAPPRSQPVTRPGAHADIAVSLAAYDRAFDAKLRLVAERCTTCGTLAYPARFRCLTCGSEAETAPVALPRDAVVYTVATIHVPVPGLSTPYTVILAELGDSAVRLLVRLTGAEAGSVGIGDRGRLVFRRVAVRTGVPDYGYAFTPEGPAEVAA